MREWIPEGIRGRMIRSRGVPRKSEDLGTGRVCVCVTWSIFKLKNISGVNYVFILGRSSTAGAAVTLCRYGSNNRRS
jgi:hypothetical protein